MIQVNALGWSANANGQKTANDNKKKDPQEDPPADADRKPRTHFLKTFRIVTTFPVVTVNVKSQNRRN
jgi:hypothetical protein